MNVFPTKEDFQYPVEPPFAVESSETWYAVAVGPRGLILRYRGNDQVLRHIGQVVKFNPQLTYIDPITMGEELVARGVPRGVEWRAHD